MPFIFIDDKDIETLKKMQGKGEELTAIEEKILVEDSKQPEEAEKPGRGRS